MSGAADDFTFLWYIPNQVAPGHRGEPVSAGHNSLATLASQALALEEHGWLGALVGAGWGRPDTFTVATALAARTTSFEPLIATRPGYWHPANFAKSAATLDQLTEGRVRVNIVSGQDDLAAYGDAEGDQASRYARTKEFMQLVRRLWTEDGVTHDGRFYHVTESTVLPRPGTRPGRPHPPLYFGGASAAAERVSATEADVQLFWGETLDGLATRIARLTALSEQVERRHKPLEFGLRITTVVRETTDEAWRAAEEKVARMAGEAGRTNWVGNGNTAVGQRRLFELAERGEVLDTCLYTAPGRYGAGGAATTWLVGSPQDVAEALEAYRKLGISHFILSDTPYLQEIARVGDQLLPLLREPSLDEPS